MASSFVEIQQQRDGDHRSSDRPSPRGVVVAMTTAGATDASGTTTIPVVDLRREGGSESSSFDNNDTDFRRVAHELVVALERYGFATLVNHGISHATLQGAFHASRSFFALDATTKHKYAYRGHDCNCGYIGVGQECHTIDDTESESADIKETYDIAPEPIDDSDGDATDASGETPWPDEEDLETDAFKSALVTYFDCCNQLHLYLLRLIAVGLGLPSRDALVNHCDERHCNLRLLRYPSLRRRRNITPGDDENKEEEENRVVVRGARHTDFGTLTLLAQDDVGGLRVQPRISSTRSSSASSATTAHAPWIHVHPVKGSLVLNVGDMLQRWTNDRLVATPHQVVSVLPPPPKDDEANEEEPVVMIPERYSIAFFCNANKGTVLRPISSLVKNEETPKYEDVTALEYLTRRLAETIRPPSAA